jgi:endonuclease YncB( thermonuclease family)
MKLFFTLFFSLFFTSVLIAEPLHSYKVLKVIDGDTVEIEANYLPDPLKKHLSLRLYGIDTPEKGFRAKCSKENLLALNAKLFLEQEVSHAKKIQIRILSWDKYGGRVLGDLIIDGVSMSHKIIEKGLAVQYNGKGPKKDWCQ